jgi:hypothetical protein
VVVKITALCYTIDDKVSIIYCHAYRGVPASLQYVLQRITLHIEVQKKYT